jgi:hypothetical protein
MGIVLEQWVEQDHPAHAQALSRAGSGKQWIAEHVVHRGVWGRSLCGVELLLSDCT